MEHRRPLPELKGEFQPFWEGCQRHELIIQRCPRCGTLRHPPRPMCPNCNSMETEWVKSSGKGELYTWTVVHRPVHPAFAEVPYIVGMVELKEGVRLISNVIECSIDDLQAGMPVEVVFERVNDEIVLPKFKPSS